MHFFIKETNFRSEAAGECDRQQLGIVVRSAGHYYAEIEGKKNARVGEKARKVRSRRRREGWGGGRGWCCAVSAY